MAQEFTTGLEGFDQLQAQAIDNLREITPGGFVLLTFHDDKSGGLETQGMIALELDNFPYGLMELRRMENHMARMLAKHMLGLLAEGEDDDD